MKKAVMVCILAVLLSACANNAQVGKVDTLEIPALAISSTDVRRRAEHGEPVWYLVPDGVVQYIGKHGLYR